MFKRPIAISLSPNAQADDVRLALSAITDKKSWIEGDEIGKSENWFRRKFKSKDVFSFNSGRSAFYFLLTALGISNNDEVIIQAFTCVAVPAAVLWTEARPIFADIDDSLNINPGPMEKLINKKTKAIVVQHTFGIPAQMNKITKIAQKHNLILIEDCSHAIGASYHGRPVGSFGEVAFFSFGRDKVISCVFGGMAVINKANGRLAARAKQIYRQIPFPDSLFIFSQLLHPLAFAFILPLYNLQIGKLLLAGLLKLKILLKPVFQEELSGEKPPLFPQKLPNALALLLNNQLAKLDLFNRSRRELAQIYFNGLKNSPNYALPPNASGSIFLRFNVHYESALELKKFFRQSKIYLGNWYHNVIDPEGVSYKAIGYRTGSCPKAEKYAKLCVNLPTYPKLKNEDALKIISLLKVYDRQRSKR